MSGWIVGGVIYAMIGIGAAIDMNNRGMRAAASLVIVLFWPMGIGVILNTAITKQK